MSHDQLIASVLAAARPEAAAAPAGANVAPAAPEAPVAAAVAPVAAAAPVPAVSADQRAEIVAGERSRIRSILSCEQAKGREAFATHLAFGTSMSAEEASGFMSFSPVAAAPVAEAPAPAQAPVAALSPLDRHMAQAGIPVAQTGGQVTPPNPKAGVDLGDIYADRAKAYGQ
jgi:hypothetical protein